ncbi:hypothetical protein AB2H60_24715 (plasmid) [Escherichia coli]
MLLADAATYHSVKAFIFFVASQMDAPVAKPDSDVLRPFSSPITRQAPTIAAGYCAGLVFPTLFVDSLPTTVRPS